MSVLWVLASTSPRRKELLSSVSPNFSMRSPDFEELLAGENPRDYVLKNAVGKAHSISVAKNEVLISADTVVVLGQTILEKPKSEQHAFEMLKSLSGQTHKVMTGMCVLSQEQERSIVVETAVKFRELSESEITAYVASGEPMDKSGSYGIQGAARSMVAEIHGSYTNVMGLPLAELVELMPSFER